MASDLGAIVVGQKVTVPPGQPEGPKPGGLEVRGHGDGLVLFQQSGHRWQLTGMAHFIDDHQPVAANPRRIPGFSHRPNPSSGLAGKRGGVIAKELECGAFAGATDSGKHDQPRLPEVLAFKPEEIVEQDGALFCCGIHAVKKSSLRK